MVQIAAMSAGLWRSVELVVHNTNEIDDIYAFTIDADEDNARIGVYYQLRVDAKLDLLNDVWIRITGRCGDSVFDRTERAKFIAGMMDFQVKAPKLWWPRGYGAPNLYEVVTQLIIHGIVAAERTDQIGIRKVELERTETTSVENPGQFLFKLNNTPILCKAPTGFLPICFIVRTARGLNRCSICLSR
jgi:beta-mannosidase